MSLTDTEPLYLGVRQQSFDPLLLRGANPNVVAR
jgi:hypothetical protein